MSDHIITIADVMTKKVISVRPDTQLSKVIMIMTKSEFNGIPVVGDKRELLGIVTQYDLVIKGSGLHLPTLIKALNDVNMIHAERMVLKDTLSEINKLKASDVMNNDPLSIRDDDSIENAVLQFAEHHKVNPLVVVDADKKVVGVLSRHDVIKIMAEEELGKVVNTALTRRAADGNLEKTVSSTISRFKKEFLLVPKYETHRWIIMGLVIFIIGAIVSFLFIVKLPDNRSQVGNNRQSVLLPAGEGAKLQLLGPTGIGVGGQALYDVILTLPESIKNNTRKVNAVINFDPNKLSFVDVVYEGIDGNFLPTTAFMDIRNNSISLSWSVSETLASEVNGFHYKLGRLIFRAIASGVSNINFDFNEPRDPYGSSAITLSNGENLLDSAVGADILIR
jgi:CBS domain-containing protein